MNKEGTRDSYFIGGAIMKRVIPFILTIAVLLFSAVDGNTAAPCNCRGYAGPGGPANDGPGGPCSNLPGATGENCPAICQ
jgi:hypothetical protein